jgi:hypothetical protein
MTVRNHALRFEGFARYSLRFAAKQKTPNRARPFLGLADRQNGFDREPAVAAAG